MGEKKKIQINLAGRMVTDIAREEDVETTKARNNPADPFEIVLPGEDPLDGWVLTRFAFNPNVKNCPVIDSIRIKRGEKKTRRVYKKKEFEIFPFIPGYDKKYAISQYGTFLDLEEKKHMPGHYNAWMRTSAQATPKRKRPQVSLTKDGRKDQPYVYQLVAEMFCQNKTGASNEECEVHHVDKDPTNNSYYNLFWSRDKKEEDRSPKSHTILDRVRRWEIKRGDWQSISPEKIMYYFGCGYGDIIDATEIALKESQNKKYVTVSIPNHSKYEGARDYHVRVVRAGKTPPQAKRKRKSIRKRVKK